MLNFAEEKRSSLPKLNVSSVWSWYVTLGLFMIAATGKVYKTYNRGLRTDPYGTPQLSSRKEDLEHSILANCVRDDR